MPFRGTLQGQSMPGVPGLYTALARALANITSTLKSFSVIPGSERDSLALAPDIVHPLRRCAAEEWRKQGVWEANVF